MLLYTIEEFKFKKIIESTTNEGKINTLNQWYKKIRIKYIL